MTKMINEDVEINAFTFTSKKGFQSIPQTITINNQRYNFIDSGLRYFIQQGHQLIRLFDMTDGKSTFRLRNEDDRWTLVSIKTT